MTLTELSYHARRLTPIGIIAILVLLIVYYAFQFIVLAPPSIPPPNGINPVFGKIKEPFIKEATSAARFTFTLDTLEGQPIAGTASANVYFLPPSTTKIGYRLGTNNMAAILGFDLNTSSRDLAGTTVQFMDEKRKLIVDITSFNFSYEYKLSSDEVFFQTAHIPSETIITNKATDFLKSMGRYPTELAKGKTNIIYLFYDQVLDELSVKSTPEGANMVEVDFYRQNINNYAVVPPKYFNSQHYVVMVFNTNGVQIVRAQVKYFEISPEQVGIYPLKSGETAWKQLQEGRGMVTFYQPQVKDITFKKMDLVYLDPDTYQQYLQPVYVFLGEKDNNFVVYVPAVDDKYLTK